MRSSLSPGTRWLSTLLLLALGACATPAAKVALAFPETSRLSVAPAAGARRLQAVATYVGGHIPVFVEASAVPQVLHLGSSNSAWWHVYLFPGANVTTIYLSGFDPQRLVLHRSAFDVGDAPPPRIVDLGRNLFAHPTLSGGPPTRLGDDREAAYRAELRTVTGLDLTDYQGHWYVRARQAFVLGGVPDARRIRAHFPDAFVRWTRPAAAELVRIERDLRTLIARGALPPALPLWNARVNLSDDQVPTWPLLPRAPATSRPPPNPRNCGEVQLGTEDDDDLRCDTGADYAARTLWVVGGGGRDILVDYEVKSQVLSGGPGDDIIHADLGNDVIHFGRGWGDDVLVLRCPGPLRDFRLGQEVAEPRYWNSRYVVFGRGIRPSDLAWTSPTEIVHAPSGSRLRFYDAPCINFLAVEPGQIPAPPAGEEGGD
jgi:hypothetical protein